MNKPDYDTEQRGSLVANGDHAAFPPTTPDADSIRRLEADAGPPEGHPREFALQIAAGLQPSVAVAVEQTPEPLRELPAVKHYPHARYTQTIRVVAGLSRT
jgi:serine/threonine-protein kinase HipA